MSVDTKTITAIRFALAEDLLKVSFRAKKVMKSKSAVTARMINKTLLISKKLFAMDKELHNIPYLFLG